MATQANKLISQTQYLSIERRSAWKSEYFNGQMYAMAGASLSETTEKYDRGKKFEHYQYIKSLSEYLLVAQDRLRIEQWSLRRLPLSDDGV